ncbi:MATE family efflux transporter [Lacrimispora indolis]|uniref:MATE family efflux transporter n=1 Tax=Lacrimispora indolis TaxID=69825 RepID=UPI00040ADCF9|nr:MULTISPECIES: MATE family efflux transporter [Lachnospiraceae]
MNDFTKGSITKQIISFSIPMLIGNVFQQLYSMVDAMVVGRYVGSNALAAVGVAMSILQFLVSVLIGLTTGASVLISQYYGARKYDKMKRMVSTSVVFLGVFSVVVAVAGILFSPHLLRWLDATPEIMDDAVLYLRFLMGGMLFPVFYNMYTAYLRALGDSRSPLLILILCTIINTVLDLVFVMQFHMGVLGAAVATLIAQAVSAVLCYLYTLHKVPLLHVTSLTFDPKLFTEILKYGTPAAIQLSVVSLANLTITKLINSFGAAVMAGITAAAKIDQLAIMPVSNVSMALSTFVAQNMGAGQEDRARKGLRFAIVMMVVLAIFISVVLISLGPWLISMFLNRKDINAGIIAEVGLNYLNIMVIFYFLFAFLFAFNGFFRGVGDSVMAMVFPVASLFVRAVLAHLLVLFAGMGPEALAWSIPVGWALSSLAAWIYYYKRLWGGKMLVQAGNIENGN